MYIMCCLAPGKVPYAFIRHMEKHRIPGDSVRDAEIESTLSRFPMPKKREQKDPDQPCSCIRCVAHEILSSQRRLLNLITSEL